MSAPDRELLEMFIYETENMLRGLDDAVVRNEGADSFSEKDTNELFRIMHTIKGSAAMLQLDTLSAAAHRLEDLFSLIRAGKAKTGAGPMKMVTDALLSAIKYFHSATEALSGGVQLPEVPAELKERAEAAISALQGAAGAAKTVGTAVPRPQEPQEPWLKDAFKAKIVLKPSPLLGARALVVLRAAARLCASISSVPPEIEKHPELTASLAKDGFIAAFVPHEGVKPEEIAALINKNLHVVSCSLEARTAPADGSKEEDRIVSVRQSKLVRHLDLIEELMAAASMLEIKLGAGRDAETGRLLLRLRECATELHRSAESMNMVSVEGLFYRLRMIAREMCSRLGKDAALVCSGGGTEADRTLLDQLYDPLMHLVRNALDHGVEPKEQRERTGKPERGTVRVNVSKPHDDCLRVEVSDDGAGIDTDAVFAHAKRAGLVSGERGGLTDQEIYALLLRPGFTMKHEVTQYSGRGVGLDVVSTRVRKLGGSLAVTSKLGSGSTFVLTLPTQLSLVDVLEVKVCGFSLLVPLGSVARIVARQEFVKLAAAQKDGSLLFDGTSYLPADLPRFFGGQQAADGSVLLSEDEKPAAVCVDEVLHIHTAAIKPLPRLLQDMKLMSELYSGCATVENGRVSMVLNTDKLQSITERQAPAQ